VKPRELSQLTQEAFSWAGCDLPHLAVGASGLVGKVKKMHDLTIGQFGVKYRPVFYFPWFWN